VKIRTVSGNQVFLLPSDAILKVSAVVACTVQLGASRDYAGYFTIKKTESSANAVTIVPASGEKIDGADSVTLTTENEYKTLAPAEGGWTVVDAYTATPSLASPVLTTPLIADGDKGVTVTSANQTHATPVVTIPNIGDAADEFVMKDTAQTLTNKTLTTPVITLPEASLPLNAVASTVELAAALTALIGVNDTVVFDGNTFTMVGSDPTAGQFTDVAGLNTLLNNLAAWNSVNDTGKLTISSVALGTSKNGTVATINKLVGSTSGGSEVAKSAVTIPAATLAQLAVGDTVTFDSVVYTKASATDVPTHAFADTAGLISCIDASATWAAAVSGSDIAITAAENGTANNDKPVDVDYKRTTASGTNGTTGSKGEIKFDATHIYICSAANTITDANWKAVTIA
jgi:hypothetical protein